MDYKKIIACLDIKDGRVVKGVNFVNFKDAGDPVEIAKAYNHNKIDEIVFLDISATIEGRGTSLDIIKRAAANVSLPLTVGGGIKSLADIENILNCGAQKISISTAAFNNPNLIKQAVKKFGSQKIVIAIDTKKVDSNHFVAINGGNKITNTQTIDWAKQVEKLGASEILLTSLDADGTKLGFDIEITSAVANAVKIPVIASGGAGNMEDFYKALTIGCAKGALAASLFHFGEVDVLSLKNYLINKNVLVKV